MKMKTPMLFALAVVCGLIAMVGVQQHLARTKGATAEPMVNVFVAAKEIPANSKLDDTMLKIEKWPQKNVPQGAVTDPKLLTERVLRVRVFPGDIILEAKLGDKGKVGPSITIPKGMRVVAVPVNMTSAISGMVLPGDRVDVLVTYKSMTQAGEPIQKTRTILEYIEVFAADKKREGDEEVDEDSKATIKNMSFLVTPEQGNVLTLAQNKGVLQLALRHSDDKEKGDAPAIDESAIDSVATSQGVQHKEERNDESPRPPKEEPNLREFLDNDNPPIAGEPSPPTQTVAVEPVVESKTETWTITIFEGGEKQLVEIELPKEGHKIPPGTVIHSPSAAPSGNGPAAPTNPLPTTASVSQ